MKKSRLFLSAALLFSGATFTFAKSSNPNVVLILMDDVNHYAVSAYGAKTMSSKGAFEHAPVSTPRIDSLARDGVLCKHMHTYPLCEPTRIALMSGKNNRRNFLDSKSQHASDITFGDLFDRAGYQTGIVGKWKQTRGTKEIPGEKYIYEFGWDEFFCFDVVDQGRRMIEPKLVLNGEKKDYLGIDPETGRRFYGPDIINRYALDFIERNQEKPFFLYYSMLLMHVEHTPTPDTMPKSVFDNFDVNAGKGRIKGTDKKFYPDMMAYTDKMVGKVLDKLDELNLADNTIVVLMGDNGSHIVDFFMADGSVWHGYKGTHKDAGTHVPLLIRAPGKIPAGTKYDGLTYVTDILPMLCDGANVEVPNRADIDGISFWDQITGKSKNEPRKAITTWYIGNAGKADTGSLVEYSFDKEFKCYKPNPMYPDGRFFDLRTDIYEEAGGPEKKPMPASSSFLYAGLDLKNLTPEQQKAYDHHNRLLAEKAYVAVERLQVVKSEMPMRAGQSQQLTCKIYPSNATRNNVVWETSDPSIATIDKFGVLKSHKPGEVTVTAYSWDDANPNSKNVGPSLKRDGIKSSVKVPIAN